MPLAALEQTDWAAGMFRGYARHLIPPSGLYKAQNLLVDDDGLLYKRGGSQVFSTSAMQAALLRFLWSGYLPPGERIVFADTADFGVLSGALAPINLGLAGLTEPKRAVEIAGVLIIGGGTMYGGSLKTAAFTGGTVAVTNGSKTVTRAAGGFTAGIDAGMLFQGVAGARYYPVASIESDTSLTLRDAYQGTTNATLSYVAFSPIVTLGAPYKVADFYCAAADRLIALKDERLDFSNPAVADPAVATSGQGPHVYDTNDFHRFPEGARGIGLWDVGGTVLAFTTRGVFAVTNIVFDLTDADGNPQHRVDHISPDLILWGNAGIASFGSQLVVPATDGVWLMDGISSPRPLSISIPRLYRGYVESGYKPGIAAVHRGCYLLPILDSGNAFVDMLVCRLDRPVEYRGQKIYPWTQLGGSGVNTAALTVRSRSPLPDPQLLAAENFASPRIADVSGYFEPGPGVKRDRDGTDIPIDMNTRDYEFGHNRTQGKRYELSYEMDDAASDDPLISSGYQVGEPDVVPAGAEWDVDDWDQDDWAGSEESTADFTLSSGSAPEDPEGDTPFSWPLNIKARYARLRFYSSYPTARLVIRGVRIFVRRNRKDS